MRFLTPLKHAQPRETRQKMSILEDFNTAVLKKIILKIISFKFMIRPKIFFKKDIFATFNDSGNISPAQLEN